MESQQVDNRHHPSSGCACNAGSLHSALVRHSGKTHGVDIRLLALRLHCLDHHSLAYGFCWVHRAFITYGVLISFCIDFQRSFGFGVLRQPLHLQMVALGLLLFFVFIKKKAWNEFYERNINHLNEK